VTLKDLSEGNDLGEGKAGEKVVSKSREVLLSGHAAVSPSNEYEGTCGGSRMLGEREVRSGQ
jgi:hypothetical protein